MPLATQPELNPPTEIHHQIHKPHLENQDQYYPDKFHQNGTQYNIFFIPSLIQPTDVQFVSLGHFNNFSR